MNVKKKLTVVVFVVLVVALVGARSARAQIKPVTVNVGGGFTVPTSTVSDYFGTGFNFDFGVTFNFDEYLGLQLEYGFNDLGQKGSGFDLPTEEGDSVHFDLGHRTHDVTAKLVFHGAGHAAGLYLLAGVGYYHRTVEVTTPGTGSVLICNPWWYICYPAYVPVTQVVGSRSSNDYGINLGGGVSFPMGRSTALYVEARYHYVYGPTVQNPLTGTTQKANGQYFPVTVGFRF